MPAFKKPVLKAAPTLASLSKRSGDPPLAQAANPYSDILVRFGIEAQYHDAFQRFVETGLAASVVSHFMETNPNWRLALELAFERWAGRTGLALRTMKSLVEDREKPRSDRALHRAGRGKPTTDRR